MIAVSQLPALNAILNASCAALLLAGYLGIRLGRVRWHAGCMAMAFLISIAFLVSYVTYHAHVGSVRFARRGWIRPVYFAVLLSHTVLAVVTVPLAVRTLYLALRRRIDAHRRLASITLPVWLYVSVTGVVVYWMLYRVSP